MDDVRTIDSLQALTALANPDRARMLDLLAVNGPQTTTELARATNLPTGSISHHVRVLVSAGLAEAADAGTDRRQSRWQLATRGSRWNPGDFRDSHAAQAAAVAADGVLLEREFDRAREFLNGATEPWDAAAAAVHTWLHLTPDELAQLGQELEDVLLRWRRRATPEDGAQRRTVMAFARAFPSEP